MTQNETFSRVSACGRSIRRPRALTTAQRYAIECLAELPRRFRTIEALRRHMEEEMRMKVSRAALHRWRQLPRFQDALDQRFTRNYQDTHMAVRSAILQAAVQDRKVPAMRLYLEDALGFNPRAGNGGGTMIVQFGDGSVWPSQFCMPPEGQGFGDI